MPDAAEAPDVLSPGDAFAPLTLRSNFAWSLSGNLIYAATQWALLVVIAKLGTPAMVGRFALGLAITAPIVLLSTLQLRAVQATETGSDYDFGDYLTLRVLTTVGALLVVFGVVLLGRYELAGAGIVILLVGLAKAVEAMSDVTYGFLQRFELMDRIARSMIARGLLSVAAIAGVMFTLRDVREAALGYAVAGVIVFVGYDIPSTGRVLRAKVFLSSPQPPRLGLRRPDGKLLRLTALALPLGVVMFLISLNLNIPRYFLERSLGEAPLGYFAAISYLFVAGNTLVIALGQSVSPRMARSFREDRDGFKALVLRMVSITSVIGVLGVVAAVVVGRFVLTVLYRPEYADRNDVLIWLMVAAALGFVSSVFGFALTAARSFRIQVPLYGAVVLSTFVACWILIPEYELFGAAYALVLSGVVQLLLSTFALLWTLRGGSE